MHVISNPRDLALGFDVMLHLIFLYVILYGKKFSWDKIFAGFPQTPKILAMKFWLRKLYHMHNAYSYAMPFVQMSAGMAAAIWFCVVSTYNLFNTKLACHYD